MEKEEEEVRRKRNIKRRRIEVGRVEGRVVGKQRRRERKEEYYKEEEE